jgi:hypothetical protein
MSATKPEITHDIPGFIMTRYLAETLWGQILRDVEAFEPSEVGTYIWLLGKLGYEPAFDFMTQEYRYLEQMAREQSTKPAAEPTVPHHYIASLYGGSGGIYVSLDKDAARREAELDAGRGNIMSFRPATEDEVEWHRSVGGRINIVEPKLNPSHYMGENR